MKVVQKQDLDPETYCELLVDAYKTGYVADDEAEMSKVRAWLRTATEEVIAIASYWEAGTVLERRGDMLNYG